MQPRDRPDLAALDAVIASVLAEIRATPAADREVARPLWRERLRRAGVTSPDAVIDTELVTSTCVRDSDVSPWSRAVSAAELLAELDADVEWIARDFAAPGSITAISAPRGLGKSHIAHGLAVAVATGGTFRGEAVRRGRVLIVDRDNPRRVVRRRLRAWGADAAGDNLMLLTRDDAPSLLDPELWESFPFSEYSLVIVDSWGSSTEGVDDREAGRTGEALSVLLDLARRGPAVIVLLNTPKDGKSYRGSGVIGDRLDILYEVRDVTDLKPSAKGAAWWSTLADASEGAWQDRAVRRRRRDDYRLALVSSKFRDGEEPDPIALELRLGGERWSLADVTAELERAHSDARIGDSTARERADHAALEKLLARCASGPLAESEAVEVLREAELSRDRARAVIDAAVSAGKLLRNGLGKRADPFFLAIAARIGDAETPCDAWTCTEPILAGSEPQAPRESTSANHMPDKGQSHLGISRSKPERGAPSIDPGDPERVDPPAGEMIDV